MVKQEQDASCLLQQKINCRSDRSRRGKDELLGILPDYLFEDDGLRSVKGTCDACNELGMSH